MLLKRNTFVADEAQIFEAVHEWTRKNADVEYNKVVDMVRLPLMTVDELLNIVRPSKLVHADILLNVIEEKNHVDSALHSKAIGTLNSFNY